MPNFKSPASRRVKLTQPDERKVAGSIQTIMTAYDRTITNLVDSVGRPFIKLRCSQVAPAGIHIMPFEEFTEHRICTPSITPQARRTPEVMAVGNHLWKLFSASSSSTPRTRLQARNRHRRTHCLVVCYSGVAGHWHTLPCTVKISVAHTPEEFTSMRMRLQGKWAFEGGFVS